MRIFGISLDCRHSTIIITHVTAITLRNLDPSTRLPAKFSLGLPLKCELQANFPNSVLGRMQRRVGASLEVERSATISPLMNSFFHFNFFLVVVCFIIAAPDYRGAQID
jgi:hypothetical protein